MRENKAHKRTLQHAFVWFSLTVAMFLMPAWIHSTEADGEDRQYFVAFEEGTYDLALFEEVLPERGLEEEFPFMESVLVSLTADEKARLLEEDVIEAVTADQSVSLTDAVLSDEYLHVGADRAFDAGFTGAGVKVAIMDTGIAVNHPDLDFVEGYNFVSNNTNVNDDNGHGSHVAGILAGNGRPGGIRGIAPEAELYIAKIMDDRGEGFESNMVRGIEWALERNVAIINLSVGSQNPLPNLERAIERAPADAVTFVGASGNRGRDGSPTVTTVDYPARYPGVIAVGASDLQDRRAAFSGYGPELDLVAPGVAVRSASTGTGYERKSGTSMAAPMVSGALAVMKEANPDFTASQMRARLTEEWVVQLGLSVPNRNTGFGRLSMPDVFEDPPAPVESVTATLVTRDTEEATVRVDWDSPHGETSRISYEVRRNDTVIYEGGEGSFTDTVTENGTYRYQVTVVRSDGTRSEAVLAEEEIGVRLLEPEEDPPEPVNEVSAALLSQNRDEAAIAVEWTSPHGSDERIRYELRRQGRILYEGPHTSFTDTVTEDGNYRYTVTVVRDDGARSTDVATQSAVIVRFTDPVEELIGAFSDVTEGRWYNQDLAYLYEQGLISGYADGTIRPNAAITRGEITVMLQRYHQWPQGTVTFPDVSPQSFASSAITAAASAGIISGYPDGTFRPSEDVTRGETAVLLDRAFSYSFAGLPPILTDVNPARFDAGAIARLSLAGVIRGYEDNTFRPDAPVTRAEFAAMMRRTLED